MTRKTVNDFPPEVLKLFDGYVHGRVTRREFLDRAAKFAVGGVTAAALLESLQPNFALAQQVIGILHLASQLRDFIRASGRRVQGQRVRQTARVFVHNIEPPRQSSGKQQMNEQGAERSQDPAIHHGAKLPPACYIAVDPRLIVQPP